MNAKVKNVFWLFGLLLIIWLPLNTAKARNIGGEPCDLCITIIVRATFEPVSISLTQGNLSEQYHVASLVSANGPTVSLDLHYNSYNADYSHALLDSDLGYGWTHSYNIFLFSQGAYIFRSDGDGKVTRYQPGPGGIYVSSNGYFETLKRTSSGFTLRKKDGTTYYFAQVPGDTLLVNGPIWRLVKIAFTDLLYQEVTRAGYPIVLNYSAGKLSTITDRYQRSLTLAYNAQGHLASIKDPLDHTTTIEYDSTGRRLISITDPNSKSVRYGYNFLNQMTEEVDKNGNRTTFQYSNGKPVGAIDANGDREFLLSNPINWATDDTILALTRMRQYIPSTTSKIDGRGNLWKYDYDQNGFITKITAPDGVTTTYTYDPVILKITSVTDGNRHTTFYSYDGRGNLIQIKDALGYLTTFTYEPVFNNVTTVTDANGHPPTRFDYDTNGNLVRETDPYGNFREWTYDSQGNISSYRDKHGIVINGYTYDAFGNLLTRPNGAGDVTRFTYDVVGNILTVTPPIGNTYTLAYDPMYRLTGVTDLLGQVASFSYNGSGDVTRRADGNGNGTNFQYDQRHRLMTITDARQQSVILTYDGNDNRLTVTDRNGHLTQLHYDVQNRLDKITDALSLFTRYEYDNVGNLLKLIDAKSPPGITQFTYDADNRLLTETYPDAPPNTRYFAYDPVGNPIHRLDQNGRTTNYSYDSLNRLTSRSYAPTGTPDNYSYDEENHILTAERGGWLDTFTYDGAYRVVQAQQNGQTVGYAYYDANHVPNLRAITYPGGRVVTEHFDLRRRLDNINDSVVMRPIADYDYDLGNRALKRKYRNKCVAKYSYNENDWLMQLDHTCNTVLTAGFGYDYDKEGNKLFEHKLHNLAASEAYSYDDIDRLIDFKVGAMPPTHYIYDPVGNLLSKINDSVHQDYTYNLADQIDGLTYDHNGNLTDDGSFGYVYDEENRLLSVTRHSDNRVVGKYRYDAFGRRVAKIADPDPLGTAAETHYFYDGHRIIEEQNSIGATLATYVYGNYIDEVLTMDRSGQSFFYHQNTLWSVAAVTDNVGGVVERYSYDAYGLPNVTNGAGISVAPNDWGTAHSAIGNPSMFTGRQFEEETGIYFYRARHYDPVTGRFVQRDTVEYTYPTNLYFYASDNPINFLDPLGLTNEPGRFGWDVYYPQTTNAAAPGPITFYRIPATPQASQSQFNLLNDPSLWETWTLASGNTVYRASEKCPLVITPPVTNPPVITPPVTNPLVITLPVTKLLNPPDPIPANLSWFTLQHESGMIYAPGNTWSPVHINRQWERIRIP